MNKHARRLELDKILRAAAEYAATEGGRALVTEAEPATSLQEARELLACTREASSLLFELGAGSVQSFPPLGDSARRAEKGASLTCTELMDAAALLRSARLFASSVLRFPDLPRYRAFAENIVSDEGLETDIFSKIVGEGELDDRASEKLYALRQEIRTLGERIRARLAQYLSGEDRKYLQDGIVTVRGDRYVIPVKAEYKRSVKGFVHDRSQSGATLFIEPEEVLEMNNELRTLMLDEQQEIARILAELSRRVGAHRADLERDCAVLYEADAFYARAEYGYRTGSVPPVLNDRGIVDIRKGRHPLLDRALAVPVSVAVGEKFRFLIISGANAGGKTVTLKTCGLFCLMAACGLFVPAAEGTRIAVFGGVYCDLGDSQSIEENRSTFSSHVENLREILGGAGENSLVLVDEPGGGTDPEEGQALARALLDELLARGCRGVFTTHYSALKEHALRVQEVENGCMEFDEKSFRPLYRLKRGALGASNALAVCERLGLPASVLERARGYLSEGALTFERTVRAAEESRVLAEEGRRRAAELEAEWNRKLAALEEEERALKKEREKLTLGAKMQARRIVAERTARAEEIVEELEELLKRETLTEGDLIRARTLKNRLKDLPEEKEEEKFRAEPADLSTLKAGDPVFIGSMGTEGEVLSVRREKGYAEVIAGSLRVRVKAGDLFNAPERKKESGVRVVKKLADRTGARAECNLIGLSSDEALLKLDEFLDGAVLAGFREVRIVHGMGTGKLRAAVREALKKDSRVAEYRQGMYGEGESGVTVATLK